MYQYLKKHMLFIETKKHIFCSRLCMQEKSKMTNQHTVLNVARMHLQALCGGTQAYVFPVNLFTMVKREKIRGKPRTGANQALQAGSKLTDLEGGGVKYL